MALIQLDGKTLGNIGDLTTPTSTRVYTLGDVFRFMDTDTKSVKEFMYVKSHAALTQYQPYVINQSATAGSEFITAVPFTLASAQVLVGVPQVAFTSGYYGFVQIKGKASELTSEAIDAGTFVEVKTTGAGVLIATTTANPTINSHAVVVTGTTAAGTAVVNLLGYRVEIRTT